MKKITMLIVTLLFLTVALALPIDAGELDLVADLVGLLSDEEYLELNDLAQSITEQYQCEISILIVEDMGEYDAYDFAKAVYREYDYGYGAEKSGLMLFISMAERDCALVAFGFGNDAFTDHGKDVLLDRSVLPLLSNNQYYEAFMAYLNETSEYLEMAHRGTPFDINTDEIYQQENAKKEFWVKLAMTILIPLAIAGLVCWGFLRRMKTAVAQRAADYYIPDGGFVLTQSRDDFLFRTESRTQIEEKRQGGTQIDRDGASGTSRKF